MPNNDPIEICGEIIHETDLAIFFHDGKITEWVPKSYTKIDPDPYDFGEMVIITIPEWAAFEKGFI